jgi:hypothetical protein
MKRVTFIRHKDAEILFLDFSHCAIDESEAIIDQAAAVIRNRPPQSVMTLTDVTNMRFDDKLSARMKEFTAGNKPYVRAAAVLGVTGLKKILFETIMIFSKRKLHAFDRIEEAKDWLAAN